jgi:hypothetical protein
MFFLISSVNIMAFLRYENHKLGASHIIVWAVTFTALLVINTRWF